LTTTFMTLAAWMGVSYLWTNYVNKAYWSSQKFNLYDFSLCHVTLAHLLITGIIRH